MLRMCCQVTSPLELSWQPRSDPFRVLTWALLLMRHKDRSVLSRPHALQILDDVLELGAVTPIHLQAF